MVDKEGRSEEQNDSIQREYLELSQQAPAKDVAIPTQEVVVAGGDATGVGKSLTEAMDEATDATDMQFAMAKLFPKDVKVSDVMIGRVAPDAFLSLLQLLVTNDMMMADANKGIDINKLIVRNYIQLTIGLDGRGRIDIAELLGAAREAKKEESLLKSIS